MLRLVTPVTALALTACSAGSLHDHGTTAEASDRPGPSAANPDVRQFLRQEYRDWLPLQYALAEYDLDGDGRGEAIVHVVSRDLCGSGGCVTLVLTRKGPSWRKVARVTASRTPVTVLPTATKGWPDITVRIGGGGLASGTAVLRFDGEAYPSNPTVPPAETTDALGTVLLAEEPAVMELPAKETSGG